ncbi:TetR/AcrR family transcriptional regulator [Actinomadura yumaensis]|uniref:TetR/AcrR family transcriptional regulator n=1 Tax=Actinomadura yumaensis TaxID=111807 RepID=UPI003620857F
MPRASAPYHHGDLRAACLQAARELLEEDGSAALSLRAVARRAGVSATAPYRHYADRDALVSAVAAQGYRELAEHLAAAHPSPESPEDLAAVAVAYVRFALDHPALFRVMFAEPCDPDSEERVSATIAIWEYVCGIVRSVFPTPTRTRCRPRSGRSSTAWRSCTWTANSTPPPPTWSPPRSAPRSARSSSHPR